MPNYLEVRHSYIDEDGDENVDTWWAVKPSAHELNPIEGAVHNFSFEAWRVAPGDTIHLYGKEDLDGLRKLLDKVEEEMESNND